MKSVNYKKIIEDFAVRIMYFLNTMDSFLLFTGLFYLVCSLFLVGKIPFLLNFSSHPILAFVSLFFCYTLFKNGDFYPTFLIFMPICFYLLISLDSYGQINLFKVSSFMFIFTSIIQIIFMGIPMGLASRSPTIPLRMYLNSFFILSPTTISLPLNIIYLTFLIYAAIY